MRRLSVSIIAVAIMLSSVSLFAGIGEVIYKRAVNIQLKKLNHIVDYLKAIQESNPVFFKENFIDKQPSKLVDSVLTSDTYNVSPDTFNTLNLSIKKYNSDLATLSYSYDNNSKKMTICNIDHIVKNEWSDNQINLIKNWYTYNSNKPFDGKIFFKDESVKVCQTTEKGISCTMTPAINVCYTKTINSKTDESSKSITFDAKGCINQVYASYKELTEKVDTSNLPNLTCAYVQGDKQDEKTGLYYIDTYVWNQTDLKWYIMDSKNNNDSDNLMVKAPDYCGTEKFWEWYVPHENFINTLKEVGFKDLVDPSGKLITMEYKEGYATFWYYISPTKAAYYSSLDTSKHFIYDSKKPATDDDGAWNDIIANDASSITFSYTSDRWRFDVWRCKPSDSTTWKYYIKMTPPPSYSIDNENPNL